MSDNHDALVTISLLSTEDGGRSQGISNGYRGTHQIKKDYQASASVTLINREKINPGESAEAYVKYMTPEQYPETLSIGQEMNILEGSRIIGKAKINKILNPILEKK